MAHLVSLISGIIFGLGLAISGMINPAKVIGFLDVTGNWDPSLAFVMGGAVAMTAVAFRLVLKRPGPFLGGGFHVPTRRDLDMRLVGGAVIFGAGWGLSGLCPGPAFASLAFLEPKIGLFVLALLAGSYLAKLNIFSSTRMPPAVTADG
ncbi:MAG: DUF6691 family protein [Alphaproteobacteria bacterium]|jgi:uncharacterized membrane protein YedE/YeeE